MGLVIWTTGVAWLDEDDMADMSKTLDRVVEMEMRENLVLSHDGV